MILPCITSIEMLFLAATYLFTLYVDEVFCENIVRHDCNAQATFYKVASNYAMIDASNITNTTNDGCMGCVDLCIEYPFCKAFNFKTINKDDAICEILHKDRTTNPNDIVPRNGWSYHDTGLFTSQIGQLCRSMAYNPCYPCLCIDSCYSAVGYTCNCITGSPGLPDIYMSFEKTIDGDSTNTVYNRGKDMSGNSTVTMVNGANIGASAGRPGKVLRMTGTNAGADAGYFQGHAINNPGKRNCSISLWIRITSPQSSPQRVFGSGSMSWDTGFAFIVSDMAKIIQGVTIKGKKYLDVGNINVYDALTSWSHIVLVFDNSASLLEVYVNGVKVGNANSYSSCTASKTNNPNLIFGGANSTDGKYWGMHVDDFAFWEGHALTSNDVIYIMNKGYVHDAE